MRPVFQMPCALLHNPSMYEGVLLRYASLLVLSRSSIKQTMKYYADQTYQRADKRFPFLGKHEQIKAGKKQNYKDKDSIRACRPAEVALGV